jgi:hypothetical protein
LKLPNVFEGKHDFREEDRMRIRKIRFSLAGVIAAASVLTSGVTLAQNVPAPVIDVTGNGSYTVSYTPCPQCVADGLEEFRASTGAWHLAGTGRVTFTNRPPDTYRYRVVYVVRVGTVMPLMAYGPEAKVVVAPDGSTLSEAPLLSAQFEAEYSITSGDANGDGRRDLLIRRGPGSTEPGDGTLADVMLLQQAGGGFTAAIPSSYQMSLASGWPTASVEARKRDVNIDGYVDLVLRDIASGTGFAGVSNQIVFAPGVSGANTAPTLRGIDQALSRFAHDIDRHLIDPEYYPNHAPVNYAVLYYYVWDCAWLSPATGGYSRSLDALYTAPCFPEIVDTYVAYHDYSGFDPDAIAIASTDYDVIHGYESADTGLEHIADVVVRVLGTEIGGWDLRRLFAGADPESDQALRGIELFAVLAGISEAVAQEADEAADPRYPDRVLLKGRRVLGQGPFHTALEYQYSTVSAYDSDPSFFDGTLISQVNWPKDHPSLTLRMGYVDGPASPAAYWSNILAKDARYDDDLPYDLFPSIGQGGYNSNSFISGLILATLGQPTVQMTTFVGGERPVPASAFN